MGMPYKKSKKFPRKKFAYIKGLIKILKNSGKNLCIGPTGHIEPHTGGYIRGYTGGGVRRRDLHREG